MTRPRTVVPGLGLAESSGSRILSPVKSLLTTTVVAAAVLFSYSCTQPVTVADLVAQFPEARKQPADTAFEVADVTIDGVTRRSIIARGQTRVTTHATIPKHAVLKASVAVHPDAWDKPGNAVLLFIGISDGRMFDTKASVTLDAFNRPADRRWRDISVSLEEFAGLTINIVLNTRAGEAADATAENGVAVWGEPQILAR